MQEKEYLELVLVMDGQMYLDGPNEIDRTIFGGTGDDSGRQVITFSLLVVQPS